jgi:hypothetical protein
MQPRIRQLPVGRQPFPYRITEGLPVIREPIIHRLVLAISGVFTPVLAKHSKSFSLIDCISVGVDRVQWNFEPM